MGMGSQELGAEEVSARSERPSRPQFAIHAGAAATGRRQTTDPCALFSRRLLGARPHQRDRAQPDTAADAGAEAWRPGRRTKAGPGETWAVLPQQVRNNTAAPRTALSSPRPAGLRARLRWGPEALGGTKPVTATQARGQASDARASPSHRACNGRHHDLGSGTSLALGPQRCPSSAPTSPQSRRSLVTTRGSQDAAGPHHPQPGPLPESRERPGGAKPRSRGMNGRRGTLGHTAPARLRPPTDRRPRATCARG